MARREVLARLGKTSYLLRYDDTFRANENVTLLRNNDDGEVRIYFPHTMLLDIVHHYVRTRLQEKAKQLLEGLLR